MCSMNIKNEPEYHPFRFSFVTLCLASFYARIFTSDIHLVTAYLQNLPLIIIIIITTTTTTTT
jgi:hypothetical protein